MQLIFNNLEELHDMLQAMGYVRRDTIAVDLRVSDKMVKDLAESMQSGLDREAAALVQAESLLDQLADIPTGTHEDIRAAAGEVPAEPTKRKRRTKAEIEAEKAAQSAAAIVVATETGDEPSAPQASPLDNLKPEPAVHHTAHNDQARAEIAEMAALFDGADRLAHINEGRDFIAKHGFPTYNETMQLADVPANIAGHTPEQVSRHRAAMAWKAAQLAGG